MLNRSHKIILLLLLTSVVSLAISMHPTSRPSSEVTASWYDHSQWKQLSSDDSKVRTLIAACEELFRTADDFPLCSGTYCIGQILEQSQADQAVEIRYSPPRILPYLPNLGGVGGKTSIKVARILIPITPLTEKYATIYYAETPRGFAGFMLSTVNGSEGTPYTSFVTNTAGMGSLRNLIKAVVSTSD